MTDLTDRLARVVELCEEQKRRGLIGGADWVSAWRAYNEAMHAFIRDDTTALLAEVAALNARIATLRETADRATARADDAEKVAREAKADAARYRGLAELTERDWSVAKDAPRGGVFQYVGKVGLDAAIDAAILAHHGAGTGEGNG